MTDEWLILTGMMMLTVPLLPYNMPFLRANAFLLKTSFYWSHRVMKTCDCSNDLTVNHLLSITE